MDAPEFAAVQRHEFVPEIEGLRGLAVLLVVAYHAGLAVRGGFVGVDVFFVLSGYLISGLMVRELEDTGRLRLLSFYARRVRRLLPAAAVVLVVTVVLLFAVYSPFDIVELSQTAQKVAVYVGNVHFASAAVDYQQAGSLDPFLHTWSLAVEEQFYVVWPLLVGGLMWLGGRRGASRKTLIIGMIVVSVSSFALCVRLTSTTQPWAFFLSPPRAWEFGVGALAALVPTVALRNPRRGRLAGFAGLSAILVAAFRFDNTTTFPGAAAALPVLGTALLLVAVAARGSDWAFAPLRHRVMQWLGKHSYGWYLWHWPLVALVLVARPHASTGHLVVASLVALACAVVMLKLVERPVRTSGRLVARPGASIVLGLALCAGSVAVATAAYRYAAAATRRPEQRALISVRAAPRYIDCMLKPPETSAKPECVFGDARGTQTMVLFGDSHAAQWLEGMDQVAKARGWRLVVLTKAECPAAYVRGQISSQLKRPYRECNAWRTRTMNEIIALRPVLTVLGSSQLYVSPDRLSRWRASMRATSQRLSDAGLNHVVLLDTPNPAWDIPGCLSAADFAPLARNNCDFPRAEAIHSDVLRATRQAVSAIPHARVVDMNDLICPTAVCPARTNNLVVYRDFSHLSDEFVLSLVPELSARMAPTG